MSDQAQQAFEKWISSPPFEQPINRYPQDPALACWPGKRGKRRGTAALEKAMSDLSNRLRDRASELSDVGFFATAQEMRQAAADIAELTELVEAQKQEILDLHDVRDQRDEWERRAQRLHDLWMSDADPREATEAAQWFEEN